MKVYFNSAYFSLTFIYIPRQRVRKPRLSSTFTTSNSVLSIYTIAVIAHFITSVNGIQVYECCHESRVVSGRVMMRLEAVPLGASVVHYLQRFTVSENAAQRDAGQRRYAGLGEWY